MNWKRNATIITVAVGVIELVSRISTGAWLVLSWLQSLYVFIVNIPYLPPIPTLVIGFTIGVSVGTVALSLA